MKQDVQTNSHTHTCRRTHTQEEADRNEKAEISAHSPSLSLTHTQHLPILCMHILPNITKTHIKTSGKDSRRLLKRQKREVERRRGDTLAAIKDGGNKNRRGKMEKSGSKKTYAQKENEGEFASNQHRYKI